jgi:hypothetical protein
MLLIAGKVDGRHATRAELALDVIPVGEQGRQTLEICGCHECLAGG